MNLYYSPAYVASAHAFETTRKAKWIADSLRNRPINGVTLVKPGPLTEEMVKRFHVPEYVDAVKTGEPRFVAESQGFRWDKKLFPMVLSSNGGVVAAALDALRTKKNTGSLSSGLHHAYRDAGSGFCTFNGLAMAAVFACNNRKWAKPAKNILILDLDAHCGGGTHSMIEEWNPVIEHIDVSVSSHDSYDPVGTNRLSMVGSAKDYVPKIQSELTRLGRYDLCIYNAGMDPYGHCMDGAMQIGVPDLWAREKTVFSWARRTKTPVAFVLAGGYLQNGLTKAELVDLHRLTIAEAAR